MIRQRQRPWFVDRLHKRSQQKTALEQLAIEQMAAMQNQGMSLTNPYAAFGMQQSLSPLNPAYAQYGNLGNALSGLPLGQYVEIPVPEPGPTLFDRMFSRLHRWMWG